MTDVDIHRFTPDDGDDVRAALEIGNAVSAADAPWEHPTLLDHYLVHLRLGWDGEPGTPYLMSVDGVPVARGSVSASERDNLHLAWIDVQVLPDKRRQGYGSLLLDRLVAEVRALGRTMVGTDGWESEQVLGFTAKHGLEKKAQAINRRQHLTEVSYDVVAKLYDEASGPAADYELVRIVGRVPADMSEAVVELSAAINDAPTDDLDIEDELMSVERLQAYESSVIEQGHRLYRLVARHRETGALGGHTVVAVDERRPALGEQHDTAVARAHRGHRLGLLLKAGMLIWLAVTEPQVETIDTWNAESNDHMIGVNELLGYRVMGRALEFQKPV